MQISMLKQAEPVSYDESREKASEYLRQIIGMFNQYAVSPNPISYTVLYDYLAGRDADLVTELDQARQQGLIDDILTRRLYERFILQRDRDQDFEHLQGEIRRIVEQTLDTVKENGTDVEAGTERLEREAAALAAETDTGALRRRADRIVHEARRFGELGRNMVAAMESTSRDIQLLQEELKKARRLAERDALTGVLNRGAFDAALETTIKTQGSSSLILLDVDDFKRINDGFGHLIGDKVIRYVATLLTNHFKGKDTVARFGGDEFGVILPNTPSDVARKLAEQLRIMMEQSRLKRSDNGEPLGSITLSIGVASLRSRDTPESFLARADRALYAAKEAGRNRVRLSL